MRWKDTELNNESTKKLSSKDIEQLLLNRGASNKDIKKKKLELIKLLKSDISQLISDSQNVHNYIVVDYLINKNHNLLMAQKGGHKGKYELLFLVITSTHISVISLGGGFAGEI